MTKKIEGVDIEIDGIYCDKCNTLHPTLFWHDKYVDYLDKEKNIKDALKIARRFHVAFTEKEAEEQYNQSLRIRDLRLSNSTGTCAVCASKTKFISTNTDHYVCSDECRYADNIEYLIINSLFGFAIGDALGLPVEFYQRKSLDKHPIDTFLGNLQHNVPKGTWSDDTSLTLATMDAITKTKEINLYAIMDNFVKWFKSVDFICCDHAFGVGRTCSKAIFKYIKYQIDPKECGGKKESENGNGSLMRMMPIAFYVYYKDIQFEDIVKDVSSLSHSHEISIIGCLIYVQFFLYLLKTKNKDLAYEWTKNTIHLSGYSKTSVSEYQRILVGDIRTLSREEINSSGYVVDTLEASIWSLFQGDDYLDIVLKAVNLGGDTDTIAAITGSLAGLLYKVPQELKSELQKPEYIYTIGTSFAKLFK